MMGSFFLNMHIRKGKKVSSRSIMHSMESMMRLQGYESVASAADADAVVIVADSESSDWVSVYSDCFEFEDDGEFAQLAAPVSSELHTDVLDIGCFDSDYLYMNLINAPEQVNAWAAVGECEWAEDVRRTDFSAWEGKVHNSKAFEECLSGEYLFAEDVLDEMEECLRLPMAYSAASVEDFDEEDASVRRLYFRLKQEVTPQGAPRLSLRSCPVMPCFLESRCVISALNSGGESKGLKVLFTGSYVENEEITFSDVCFVKWREEDPFPYYTPIRLEKVQLEDGRWVYCHHDPELVIPPKIDERLPKAVREELEFTRSVGIRFTPHGNKRKLLDITVQFIPDENPEGRTEWNVWRQFGSKENFIKEYNKRFVGAVQVPLRIEDFD